MPDLLGLRPLSVTDGGRSEGLSERQVRQALKESLGGLKTKLKKVLLIPPDYTRLHSYAGVIAGILHEWLSPGCEVDILPALGTHAPVSREEWDSMYAGIPYDRMLTHHWRDRIVRLGAIPAEKVSEITGGIMDSPIPVEISQYLTDASYDLILSIGQVVPHEVAGMSSHLKNIFVGCGGAGMINASHMAGALCGMENIMGRDRTPVRALFDYAGEHFLASLPILHILTVTTVQDHKVRLHGLFIGKDRKVFEDAVALSGEKNVFRLDRPVKKMVVALDEREFKSTWVGDKAIYRTRMAIADGGDLIVLAPGVNRFGEDSEVDRLIRKYGYRGREQVIRHVRDNQDLRANLSAAAHLIHGSSEGRFSVTYCVRHLSRDEVEGVGYRYLPYDEAIGEYAGLNEGWNTGKGDEEVYYISNPALGLWMEEGRA